MSKIDLELCYMTGTEALAALREKKLSPVELMKAVVARCEAVNPKVNAITYEFFDRALKQARQAESKYTKKSARPRPRSIACFAPAPSCTRARRRRNSPIPVTRIVRYGVRRAIRGISITCRAALRAVRVP